jgi:hypothetical protein
MQMQAEPIIEALEQQVECYRRLARLSEAQHEHVQQSQMEQLLEVLQSRQQVLDELRRLEGIVGPARRAWSQFIIELSGEQRLHADAMLAETRTLLEQITAADRNDALVLQQRKLNLGRQINQATAARQVNRTYAASAYGPAGSRMDMQR